MINNNLCDGLKLINNNNYIYLGGCSPWHLQCSSIDLIGCSIISSIRCSLLCSLGSGSSLFVYSVSFSSQKYVYFQITPFSIIIVIIILIIIIIVIVFCPLSEHGHF